MSPERTETRRKELAREAAVSISDEDILRPELEQDPATLNLMAGIIDEAMERAQAGSGASVAPAEPPCGLCGGPCQFDTSVPSVLWNQVIRAEGLPEYLCLSCIVLQFVKVRMSFVAALHGGDLLGIPIEVRIAGVKSTALQQIQQENNMLRLKIRAAEATLADLKARIEALPLPIHHDSVLFRLGFQEAIVDVLALVSGLAPKEPA